MTSIMCASVLANFSQATLSLLPRGFTYLHEVDPSIIINMRYAGNNNFVGSKIDGYINPVAILTKQAAEALYRVQRDLNQKGYSLVVYDAYRPVKAVEHFMKWVTSADNDTQAEYYPYIDKTQIISRGYVAKRSSHSRGSTVDVSIIELGRDLHPIKITTRILSDSSQISYLDDGTVDMGGSFDLFHEMSHHDSKISNAIYNKHREILKNAMIKHGFKPISSEWWHYTLENEPFPEDYFDFNVQ